MTLKNLREKSKLSQAILAKEFNVSQSKIARVECYQAPLTVDLFDKYSEKFGLNKDIFYYHCKKYELLRSGQSFIEGLGG